ncbi:hypothetical protein [Thomasclavelia spiroformis]|uniref:hypothetical protein n=1 Tax=Thomasclavelia spiroformis TaxID=29348 RepID=UPI00399F5410
MIQKRNNILFAITVIILCVLIVIIIFYDRNRTEKVANKFNSANTTTEIEKEKPQEKEDKEDKTDESEKVTEIPTIYCVGDSTTIGSENQNNSYVTYLSQSLNANIKVIGDAKLTSSALLVKLGVTPVYVDKLSIPSTTTPTPIVFLDSDGKANNDLLECQGSIEKVTINGIEGTITYQYEGNTLVFTRNQPGEASIVNSPTLLQVNSDIESDSILILYTGAYEESIRGSLANYQNQIIRAFNTDKYIVVSLTQDDRNETNQALKNTHGEHFLDFKNYLLTSGLNDLGIQPTPVDQQNIAENKIPDSLKADSINGNDKYSQLLSNQIIKKLTEMQYIK